MRYGVVFVEFNGFLSQPLTLLTRIVQSSVQPDETAFILV
jgi:hypothetical protein